MSKFLFWILWLNLSRFNLTYLVLELIVQFVLPQVYKSTPYIIFLASTYAMIVAMETAFFFYFYLKVKNMESIWDDSKIHRIKK